MTESESEPEDPLAESSASFLTGYDPAVNTPKHEQTEGVKTQLSYTEPSVSAPPLHQDSDNRQDSWSSGMAAGITQQTWPQGVDTQASQPDLPPQVPEPAQQPPYFIPGPPVTQPLPGQIQGEKSEAVEEQPVYGQQWSEGVNSNDVQPPPQQGTCIQGYCLLSYACTLH